MTDFHTSLDAALTRHHQPQGRPMLTINAVGLPAPQGSKRGFYNAGLGRVQMVESSKKVKPWRQDVVAATLGAIADQTWAVPAGPVEVAITFHMPRPGYHFGTGRNAHVLKPNAPTHVDKKPDIDKLVRSTLDALTSSGAVKDDAQVARLIVEKVYAGGHLDIAASRLFGHTAATGAQITITPLTAVAAAANPPGETAATAQGALL